MSSRQEDAPKGSPASPIRATTTYKFSHVLTERYLPRPGAVPGWPFASIGEWMIDVNAASEDWIRGLREWRREHLTRIGYDDSIYRRAELQWAQRNFVHALAMVEDRNLYDPVSGRYTVGHYLDDLEARYGGVDSVLIWYVYPNIGIDDRNQFDLVHDLPGGLDGLRSAVAEFHKRDVKVFLPTMPWDHGTREHDRPHWEAIAELVKAVDADGINGDTYNGVPRAFFDACDERGHPVVLQPESTATAEEVLIWNVQSWTKKVPPDRVPSVPKFKWLEPRHMINIENRWSRDRNGDLQHAFFNGIGYVAWENVWGIWNELTPRDAETLRRVATIQRRFAPLLVSADWTPYEKTLQAGVFASRFPAGGLSLWTLVNRNEYEVGGEQIAVEHREGTLYFDVWNGRLAEPRIDQAKAVLATTLEGRGYAAFLAVAPGVKVEGLEAFLARMRELSAKPLRSFSATWQSAPQQLVPIDRTRPIEAAPSGMVAIPAGEFEFVVEGIEIEGQTWEGVDVQYPWETSARRSHRRRMRVDAFHMDRYPVTNEEYATFVAASAYRPRDDHNFLRQWRNGTPLPGWENKPVTWVSIEDAHAYARWAGKRLPHEWEWQYAGQGTDGRRYPWGNEWNVASAPEPACEREIPPPADVDQHPDGVSPFGVYAMVGHIWQWTDEYVDAHTRAAILRGGSAYQPQTSHWYFPQAHRLDRHGKYLLMAPCRDRSAGIGFRCVVDAT